MAQELAFVLINPYTIAKSRTGGVIARVIGRTDLSFVAGRMFGPNQELVARYAAQVRQADPERSDVTNLIADYILKSYAPNPTTGRPRRVMMLLFEGEGAVEKIWRVAGSATSRSWGGETIRDTYGDYLLNEDGKVQYFEPAVLVAPNPQRAAATLRLWARYSDECGGMIQSAMDIPQGENVQKTLVMLKPDNFRVPSLRAGNIVDILSSSGLRIVAVKKFAMTVAQAEEFYGPVQQVLKDKFGVIGGDRLVRAISGEFGFAVPEETAEALSAQIAPLFAKHQFENIVQFMTGYKPSECPEAEKKTQGSESCLALVYEGVDAVLKIRSILGSTDPSKARPGSVRREFGSNVMVNAAHASDSSENAARELRIIDVQNDPCIRTLIERYYGPLS